MFLLDEENEADRYMGRFGHRDSYLNFTETPYVTPSIDSYHWNYEAEKSYWFELSGHKERLQQLVDDGLQNIQCKIAQGGSLTNDDNSKRGTQAKLEHTTELTSADSIASENVEEKLQQMLQLVMIDFDLYFQIFLCDIGCFVFATKLR